MQCSDRKCGMSARQRQAAAAGVAKRRLVRRRQSPRSARPRSRRHRARRRYTRARAVDHLAVDDLRGQRQLTVGHAPALRHVQTADDLVDHRLRRRARPAVPCGRRRHRSVAQASDELRSGSSAVPRRTGNLPSGAMASVCAVALVHRELDELHRGVGVGVGGDAEVADVAPGRAVGVRRAGKVGHDTGGRGQIAARSDRR